MRALKVTNTLHLKSARNGPADALSHLHINALHVEQNVIINFKELAAAHENDVELVQLKSSPSSLTLRYMPIQMSDSTIACDVPTDVPHPYVPPSFKRIVVDSLHSLLHPGIRAMQRLVTVRFMLPRINSNIRKWVQTCPQCQRSRIQRHTVAPFSTFATPDAQFDNIHLDIV